MKQRFLNLLIWQFHFFSFRGPKKCEKSDFKERNVEFKKFGLLDLGLALDCFSNNNY